MKWLLLTILGLVSNFTATDQDPFANNNNTSDISTSRLQQLNQSIISKTSEPEGINQGKAIQNIDFIETTKVWT